MDFTLLFDQKIREKNDLKTKLTELQKDNREAKLQLAYQKENDFIEFK